MIITCFRIPQACQGNDPHYEDIRGETLAIKAEACHQEIIGGAVPPKKTAQRVCKAKVPFVKIN